MTEIYIKALEEYTTEELEDEIYRRKQSEKPERPKLIENPDYTELKNLCIEYIESIENKDYSIDDKIDTEHFIFESAIETFFGVEVWDYVNHGYWEEDDV